MIRRVKCEPFRSHRTTEVVFPERGLLLVGGANGSGKSSLALEAPIWAYWGATLRGGDPTCAGEACVEVWDASGRGVRRSRKNGKSKLQLIEPDGQVVEASTVTETQRLLEQRVGTLSTFLHSCVFSRELLDSFTTANDRDRKELLERLLGLDHLAEAEERARRARSDQERAGVGAEREVAVATVRFSGAEQALVRLRDDAPAAAATEEAEREIEGLAAALKGDRERERSRAAEVEALAVEFRRVEQKDKDVHRGLVEARQVVAVAKQACVDWKARLENVRALKGTCPTCWRPVTAKDLQACATSVGGSLAEAQERLGAAEKAAEPLETLADETGDALQDVMRRGRAARAELEETKRLVATGAVQLAAARRLKQDAVEARQRYEERLAEAQELTESARGELTRRRKGLEEAKDAVALYDAVVQVLGPQGARARLLAARLESIGVAATRYLRRMGLPWRVRLASTSERKSGKVVEAIGVQVEGGRSYVDASAGERRRLDVAILLALAELACTWGRAPQSALFLDEIMDALDPAGVEAVAALLADMARERCVVLITHNPELRAHLVPSVTWAVSRGADGHSRVEVG